MAAERALLEALTALADAFEVMRRHARVQRTELADVAPDVLSGRQAFRSEA